MKEKGTGSQELEINRKSHRQTGLKRAIRSKTQMGLGLCRKNSCETQAGLNWNTWPGSKGTMDTNKHVGRTQRHVRSGRQNSKLG